MVAAFEMGKISGTDSRDHFLRYLLIRSLDMVLDALAFRMDDLMAQANQKIEILKWLRPRVERPTAQELVKDLVFGLR